MIKIIKHLLINLDNLNVDIIEEKLSADSFMIKDFIQVFTNFFIN